ncbi:PQQ-binding-like beta-propeller repeat protein [Burkholderiaceae bacterium DAT-1]|nr:PQQ-binding-like beta-propeller repeat protein [Burkholderiaceae bacterium DAT-1]
MRTSYLTSLTAISAGLLLSACGGGGDSAPPAPQGQLTLSGSATQITTQYDLPGSFVLHVKNTGPMGVTNITPSAPAGTKVSNDACHSIVLAIGETCDVTYSYAGTAVASGNFAFNVNFSFDAKVGQSSLSVPYQFTESQWAKVSEWQGYRGNPKRTGYVPVTLDATRISEEYSGLLNSQTMQISDISEHNGNIFLVSRDVTGTPNLTALDQSSHKIAWSKNISMYVGSYYSQNLAPIAAAGNVYIAGSNYYGYLGSFSAKDGSLNTYSSNVGNVGSLTFVGKSIFATPGNCGSVTRTDPNTLQSLWKWSYTTPTVQPNVYMNFYASSVAAFDESIFVCGISQSISDYSGPTSKYSNNQYLLVTQQDSVEKETWIKNTLINTDNYYSYTPGDVVLNEDSSLAFLSSQQGMVAFDLSKKAPIWAAGSGYSSILYGNKVVYLLNGNSYSNTQVSAIDAKSGNTLWTGSISDGGRSSYVVTDSHLFIAGQNKTYAMNLSTKKIDWTTDLSGNLAITKAGKLVITDTNRGVIGIYNLR